ncbi:MAG: c-type cytochrome [Syntrophobacteraceae bacterium]|nr:c-type cytochrome [Desulfobacteraceae bacterium]
MHAKTLLRFLKLLLLCAFCALAANLLSACDYARMKDDEAVNTYREAMPEMPKKAIPIGGGLQELREANPEDLRNPTPATPETVALGAEKYGYFCVQCHGAKADGAGTVGQSFAPLPANLTTAGVRQQSDGLLFYKISLGFARHPPLAATVSVNDRWAIVRYIRSLANSGQIRGG